MLNFFTPTDAPFSLPPPSTTLRDRLEHPIAFGLKVADAVRSLWKGRH